MAVLIALGALVVAYIVLAHPSGSARQPSPRVTVVQSDGALGRRMATLAPLTLTRDRGRPPAMSIEVDIHSDEGTFWGVGAAVTDSSAYLIHGLGAARQTQLLTELYGRSGLGLSFGAIPIGASDYTASGRPYSLDDLPPGQTDPELRHFSVAHDERWNLPVLEQIVAIAPHIHFFATTWSAPPWMKANDRYDDVGFTGMLLPQYEQTFATYLIDWLKAYRARGIAVAALSPENEPNSPSHVPAMDLPLAIEAQFIADDLAPALAASGLSTQIFGGDVGLRRTAEQAGLIASSAGGDLGGLAWHCYSAAPTQLRMTAALAPSLRQIITECAEKLSKLPLAEDVVGALSNGASAFSAWNLALTPAGGPVQSPNHGCPGCRGLVTIDPSTHQYTLSREADILGQVGHFVAPGAVRLTSTDEPTWFQHGNTIGLDPHHGILNVAYRNPNGQVALITYNATARTRKVAVSAGDERFATTLPPGATTTFTWLPR
jgi:glucosylceramidase